MSTQDGEVSKKIRSAIKAKLEEIGAYVDEELPDYIMVMIANKKTKQQMKDDLQLFLGKNAVKFVDWLFEIFDRLQSVNKNLEEIEIKKEKEKKKSAKSNDKPKKSAEKEKKKSKVDEKIRTKEKLKEKVDKTVRKQKTSSHSESTKATEYIDEIVDKEQELNELGLEDDELHLQEPEQHIDAIDAELWAANAKVREKEAENEAIRKEKREKERRKISSPKLPVDSRKRRNRSLKSTVRLSSQVVVRPRIVADPETAPKPSLFLKAMHEANRQSRKAEKTSRKRRRSEHESDSSAEKTHSHQRKSTRIKNKSSAKETEMGASSKRRVELKGDISDNEKDLEQSVKSSSEPQTRFIITMSELSDSFHSKIADEKSLKIDKNRQKQDSKRKPKPSIEIHLPERQKTRPVKLKLLHRNREGIFMENEQMVDDKFKESGVDQGNEQKHQAIPVVDTRNVVKIEGQAPIWTGQIDPVSISLDDDDEEDAQLDGADVPVLSVYDAELPPTKCLTREALSGAVIRTAQSVNSDKCLERCRFWPACRQGDGCPFVHPSKHCLTFPKCSYGNKCLYIHPNCIFDQNCTRPNCPYTHASSGKHTSNISTAVLQRKLSIPRASTFACKFGARCTNIRCTFIHPKPCRFGTECLSAACPFAHPKKPGFLASESGKYKWKMPISNSSNKSDSNPLFVLSNESN